MSKLFKPHQSSTFMNASGADDKCVRNCNLFHPFSKARRDECIAKCNPTASTEPAKTEVMPLTDSQKFINTLKSANDTDFLASYTFLGELNYQINRGKTVEEIVTSFGGEANKQADIDFIKNYISILRAPNVAQTLVNEATRRGITKSLSNQNLQQLVAAFKQSQVAQQTPVASGSNALWFTVGGLALASFAGVLIYRYFNNKNKKA